MSSFVIGVQAPRGLDSKIYRVRVVVDRIDGEALTAEDLERIEAVYPNEPAKRRPRPASGAPTPKAKPQRRSSKAA